jgi:hypothetical protein
MITEQSPITYTPADLIFELAQELAHAIREERKHLRR